MSERIAVVSPLPWYSLPGTPDGGTYWWAVEHRGHPAFYLRSLLAGDFAPGRYVSPRHAYSLAGVQALDGEPVVCGTCGEWPKSEDLEPIERVTEQTGFLGPFRSKRLPWPGPTDPATCWLCGGPPRAANYLVSYADQSVRVCGTCADHLERK